MSGEGGHLEDERAVRSARSARQSCGPGVGSSAFSAESSHRLTLSSDIPILVLIDTNQSV